MNQTTLEAQITDAEKQLRIAMLESDERACVGARLKIQAKAKLDQISGVPAPRESVVQDMKLEVWSRSIEGSHN